MKIRSVHYTYFNGLRNYGRDWLKKFSFELLNIILHEALDRLIQCIKNPDEKYLRNTEEKWHWNDKI